MWNLEAFCSYIFIYNRRLIDECFDDGSPPDTPSRRFGFILAVFRIVAGFALRTQARPGNNSS